MKLTHVRIKDFRSFAGEHGFHFANGVNYFVGPNNCGKSNLMRALELALDPDAVYAPERDRPAMGGNVGAPPTTRITLTFSVGTTGPEKTLLRRADEYEIAVRAAQGGKVDGNIKTYASEAEVRLSTSFGARGARRTTFQTKGFGAASLPADSVQHQRLETQFRSVVRFAVVHSGEDLESLLKGKFREILQLVISDHLRHEFADAEAARNQYVSVLQSELLEPLRSRVLDRVGFMFPEITIANLVPNVPTLTETLSSVDVQLGDVVTTELTDKGTGVRGAVLVSMLQYLAEQSRRSLVLAVEEPEAFLHPAGQESIRGQLEDLAARADVSLLVTSHSPYVISRRPDALVTELRKGHDGVTSKAATARGNESKAKLLGALFRDAGMSGVLERALDIPTGTRGVLITEGFTDGAYLKIACEAAGRKDLLDGLHIIAAGAAKKVVFQAVLAKSATSLPVVALLDLDENGRSAQRRLEDFGWNKGREILSLGTWKGKCAKQHDVEIEDLIPVTVSEAIVDDIGEATALDGKIKCGDGWHRQFSEAWKAKALVALPNVMTAADASEFVWLVELINTRVAQIAAAQAKTKQILAQAGRRRDELHRGAD